MKFRLIILLFKLLFKIAELLDLDKQKIIVEIVGITNNPKGAKEDDKKNLVRDIIAKYDIDLPD